MEDNVERTAVTCVAVGLDMSMTATGFCLKEGVRLQLETIKTEPKGFPNDLERLKHIVKETVGRIPDNVRMICLEDFFTPANKAQIGAAIKLAMLGALVRVALYDRGLPFFVVAASQIKKFVTGSGASPKSIIVRETYKRWGIEAKDDNQADAAAMAYLAEALLHPEVEMPKFQKDVVNTILADRPRYNFKGKDDA